MGVVIRQSFWGTSIAYTGVLIGYFNTLYLRPEFLSLSEIGVFNLVTANAMLVSPLCSAGMPGTFIKYFPEFNQDERLRNQIFTFQLLLVLLVNLLVIAIGWIAKDFIISNFAEKSPGYVNFLMITAMIIVVNSLFELLFSFCKSVLRVIVPSFIRDIFLRAGSILLVGGFALNWWSFEAAVNGLAITYIMALLILWLDLTIRQGMRIAFSFDRITPVWRKKIINFGSYSLLLGLSVAVMNNVNYLQVSTLIGERALGIFTTCFFIGLIVEMPRRNMLKVLAPIFAKAMQAHDMDEVKKMYRKGSITLSVLGLLITIGVLTNINDLFAFIPQGNGFAEGYWVVVAVCFAKLIFIVFGFNQEIIVYSDYYRYSLFFQLLSAGLLIGLNSWLLPTLGLIGAGVSYVIAVTVHTLLKFGFIWYKFRLSPFTKAHVWLLLIGLSIFVLFYYVPFPMNPLVNILVRSALTIIVFVPVIYLTKISEDINALIKTIFEKIF